MCFLEKMNLKKNIIQFAKKSIFDYRYIRECDTAMGLREFPS